MKRCLQFSELPKSDAFDSRPILIGLPTTIAERLAALPHTLERAQSAVMFSGHATKQSEGWRAAAYIRAALMDYCAMEESQLLDRPICEALKITDTTHPLLHLLQLMRHMNIHVKTVTTERHSVPAVVGEHSFEWNTFVISGLNVNDLIALRNGKSYDVSDLQGCVDWFDQNQRHWGAGDLIALGTHALAERICTHHDL